MTGRKQKGRERSGRHDESKHYATLQIADVAPITNLILPLHPVFPFVLVAHRIGETSRHTVFKVTARFPFPSLLTYLSYYLVPPLFPFLLLFGEITSNIRERKRGEG